MTNKATIELVTWTDAAGATPGWEEPRVLEHLNTARVYSAGMVYERADALVVVPHFGFGAPDGMFGGHGSGAIVIPLGCIEARQVLLELEEVPVENVIELPEADGEM